MADNSQQNPFGPFSGVLSDPLSPQPERISTNVGYGGKPAAVALFATKFLEGAQLARRRQYEKSELEKQNAQQLLQKQVEWINNPANNYTQEAKQKANLIYQKTLGDQLDALTKTVDKDHKDNPLLHLTKAITGALIGPNQNQKNINISDSVASLSAITHDEKSRFDPNALGSKAAEGLTSAISDIENRPGVPNANTGQPAQSVPSGPTDKGSPDLSVVQRPATAQIPGLSLPPAPELRQEATAGNVALSTQAQAAVAPLIAQNIAPRTAPATAEIYRTLPQTPKPATVKTVPVVTPGPDGKLSANPVSAYQDANGVFRDPATHQVIPGAVVYNAQVKGTVAPPVSAAVQARQQQEKDIKQLHPDWDDNQVKTEAARQSQLVQASKIKTKTTPEELLAKNYLDSGKAKTPEEATKLAAADLVNTEQAKLKAATASANGQRELTPQQIQGLAQMSLLTGQVPSFGLGRSADRTAFWAAFSDLSTGGTGLGETLDKRYTLKSLQQSRSNLQKLTDTVTSYEKSAEGSLAKAMEASKNVPRDSSRLLNSWSQFLSTGVVDDKELRNFINLTETAANEYARVISGASNGGVSTVDAREQANQMISAAFGEGAFEGAADAMKTDMLIRTNALRKGLQDIDEGIISTGTKPTTPPPGTQKPQAQQFTQENPYIDKSGKKVWIGMTGTNNKTHQKVRVKSIDTKTGMIQYEPVPQQ